MRIALVLSLAALALPAPLLAQDYAPEARLAEKLNDPVLQDHVSHSMSDAMAAMLDLRIGAFERAIDPGAPVSRNETLRDRARRDDPYFEERMAHRTREVTGRMGAAAGQFAVMMPELRAMVKRMSRQFEGIADPVRDYDHDRARPDYEEYDDWDD